MGKAVLGQSYRVCTGVGILPRGTDAGEGRPRERDKIGSVIPRSRARVTFTGNDQK